MANALPRHFPGRPPIDAYGNGGFRFADMSHKGSLLIIASGVYAWPPVRFCDITEQDFRLAFNEKDQIELMLVGTGQDLMLPPERLKLSFRAKGIALDCMGTGAAARTYNVLLGEGRRVAAALIAVD